MKTHFAQVDRANESDNNDYWSPTLCGLEYTNSPLSDNIEHVTCKNCQAFYPTWKKQIEEAMKREFGPSTPDPVKEESQEPDWFKVEEELFGSMADNASFIDGCRHVWQNYVVKKS